MGKYIYFYQKKKKIDRVISDFIVKEWIKRCAPFLETPGVLRSDEFLYLFCNSIPRMQFVSYIII